MYVVSIITLYYSKAMEVNFHMENTISYNEALLKLLQIIEQIRTAPLKPKTEAKPTLFQ